MNVHLDQPAILFFAFLALAPFSPNSATSQASDPIIARLERVHSFAFGGVGFVLATSQGEFDYRAILSRKSAAADFETIFRIGNPQAKCYALTGLRQVNPGRFESLAAPLQSSGTCVAVTTGCVTFSQSMADTVKQIRDLLRTTDTRPDPTAGTWKASYDGPRTNDVAPAARAFLLSIEQTGPASPASGPTTAAIGNHPSPHRMHCGIGSRLTVKLSDENHVGPHQAMIVPSAFPARDGR